MDLTKLKVEQLLAMMPAKIKYKNSFLDSEKKEKTIDSNFCFEMKLADYKDFNKYAVNYSYGAKTIWKDNFQIDLKQALITAIFKLTDLGLADQLNPVPVQTIKEKKK